jgi:Holliday junction DNA helicase RuvA
VIAQLRGRVARQGDGEAVIDVNGVGYLVHASARTLGRLSGGSEVVELLVETHLREDSIVLFGFADDGERAWFRLLQTVQGVGSRVALSLLGVLGPDGLATAVLAQDKAALSRAPGIGSRLAGRIVAELKDRLGDLPAGQGPALRPVADPGSAGPAADALLALLKLGFGRSEAALALGRVQARLGEAATVEALVRDSLRELST